MYNRICIYVQNLVLGVLIKRDSLGLGTLMAIRWLALVG